VSHELRFERVFDASVEEVFDALASREGLEEMYGTDEPGWIVESEGEVRVGGTWGVTFGLQESGLYRFAHAYEALDRPRRIAYVVTQADLNGLSFQTRVEISLQGLAGGRTLMRIVESGFPSAEERDLYMTGMPDALERVARFVGDRGSGAWEAGERKEPIDG
jgi:uncharacterized protein YndB with AHSA1/START domain